MLWESLVDYYLIWLQGEIGQHSNACVKTTSLDLSEGRGQMVSNRPRISIANVLIANDHTLVTDPCRNGFGSTPRDIFLLAPLRSEYANYGVYECADYWM
jgi:hypothetical protein